MAHLPEHSIELEVVLLQYLYEGKRPFRIVPLVVGSFHDCVDSGTEPSRATTSSGWQRPCGWQRARRRSRSAS